MLRTPSAIVAVAWILLVAITSIAATTLPLVEWGVLADPLAQDLADAGALPSTSHWLGTDTLGRDVLSRLIFAGGEAIAGVLLCVAIATLLGLSLGLLAGYYGGAVDAAASTVGEVLQTLPGIIVMLLAVAIFGTDLAVGMATLGILLSAGVFRIVRSSTLVVSKELHVDAAKVAGIRVLPILARHVLPNVLRPTIVQASITATLALLLQAGLSFLGQGPPPPAPQWGSMVREASDVIYRFPWLMVPTGLAIILTALAFNVIGDALVDTTSIRPHRRTRRRRPVPASTPESDSATSGDHNTPAALSVTDLTIATESGTPLVHGISFAVRDGQTLGLVGESGSGKTLTALAALGLLPDGVRMTGGRIRIADRDVTDASDQTLAPLRGSTIAYVSQEPMVALDPSSTVRALLVEPLRKHRRISRGEAHRLASTLLAQVGIPDPSAILRRYPFQLSGGMAQRVAIAVALTGQPRVLVADEPTTALDVTVQAEILELLRTLRDDLGMAVLIVTHNFGVVADICDHVAVMRSGRVVESGDVQRTFARPQDAYTRTLLEAVPDAWPQTTTRAAVDAPPLLAVEDLKVAFRQGAFREPFHALKGVSLDVRPGETVGLVGESGSGKTTIGRAILGLTPAASGRVIFDGEDITHASARRRRELSTDIQVVFQDPYSSLDPRLTIGQILEEPLKAHGVYRGAAARRRVTELLDRVHLPADALQRRPSEFSGGQRQRIAIARALAMSPRLIVCDEALSALDLSTQARVVELLHDIQRDTGVAYLFIGHDLAVVRNISDRVVVLYRGEVMETGDPETIGASPRHPYTRRLLLAAPVPDPVEQAERRKLWLASRTTTTETEGSP
ncbi:dipeptide ABC transporter ATP-binding protein [Microbacterium sp. LRZ72]|uniref:dipeptide ABC transporter ATP-binding protein n=1 Tax=Microbacterium sp. LRZ72 TaxID=2942481 RepID=UPI0029C09327|nr:dipeptide ABC transporter ATP-binding protein [Microbacterium sp. LRZ72]